MGAKAAAEAAKADPIGTVFAQVRTLLFGDAATKSEVDKFMANSSDADVVAEFIERLKVPASEEAAAATPAADSKIPNSSDKQEIRYTNVANEVDLVLTIDQKNQKVPYAANNGAISNGVLGKLGQVNVLGGTAASLTFTLVEAGTDTPVYVAPDQKVFFSVYDLDQGSSKKGPPPHEYATFTTPLDSYKVTPTTTVKITGNKNSLQATSGRAGNAEDNPTDPLDMTQVQMDSTVWVTYQGRNTWGLTFGE